MNANFLNEQRKMFVFFNFLFLVPNRVDKFEPENHQKSDFSVTFTSKTTQQ